MSIARLVQLAEMGRGITISSTIIRPDNATPYTACDVVGTDDLTFDALNEMTMLYLMSVILRIDVASLPSGMIGFNLHLYNALTAVQLVDNVPMTFLTADKAKYLTTIILDAPSDKGDFLFSRTNGIDRLVTLTSGKVWGRLETLGDYTPTNLASKTISLIGVGI
jgi:hypothetical protein